MDNIRIELTPYNRSKEIIDLVEYDDYIEEQVGNIYCNLSYSIELVGIPEDYIVDFFINDNLLTTTKENVICLNQRIFTEYFGNISFSIVLSKEEEKCVFKTGVFAACFGKNSSIGKSIANMIQYILSYNYIVEPTSTQVQKNMDLLYNRTHSSRALINQLTLILNLYKSKVFEFTNRAHKIQTKKIKMADIERANIITSQTVRYIATHPEYLIRSKINTGIEYNDEYYYPCKTAINSVVDETNNYENEVVISFLATVLKFIADELHEVEALDREVVETYIDEEYISPRSELMRKTKSEIEFLKFRLIRLRNECMRVQKSYSMIFPSVKVKTINAIPKKTKIFERVNHYREVYQLICYWFTHSKYSLYNEKLNLYLAKSSLLYEHYLLLKMINRLKENGYKCIEKSCVVYEVSKYAKYKNTPYNNRFVFERENEKKTLFYQPVINKSSYFVGINLYKSVSKNSKGENNAYYTPDFILKSGDGDERYKIIDAKFQEDTTFLKYGLQDIVFKYIFSIGKINKGIIIDEVSIVCGKSQRERDKKNNIQDIGNPINGSENPDHKLCIYTVNGKDEYEENRHTQIIDELLK